MSTIYVFQDECPAIAASGLATGDLFLVYDTSAKTTKRALGSDIVALLASGGQASLTTTATGATTTLNSRAGVVTTEAMTISVTGSYTLTITNSFIAATDLVFASVQNGTNTAGQPTIGAVTPASGTLAIKVLNGTLSGGAALSGTLKLSFQTFAA